MKKLIPTLSAVCLSGAVVTSIFLVQTNWSFSVLFKTMLLFISAFIGLIAFWKSDFNKWIATAVVMCFGTLLLIFFKTGWYDFLWNYVLAGHVLLIGYSLYREVNHSVPSLLRRVTSISVIISMILFAASIVFKIKNEFIHTGLFTALSIMSVFIVIHKLTALLKRK